MARPKLIPPENAIEIVTETASRGCNEKTIAYALGISWDTWVRWREDYPELKEAHERGKAREHDMLVGVLHDKAAKGDIVACMFLLKCRHNYREGAQIEQNRTIQIGVMLPQSLSPEQYMQLIQNPQKVIDHE